jgi:hypothetical protein
VVKVLKLGTNKLANEDGKELTNAWNIQQLRRFQVFSCCKSQSSTPQLAAQM